MPYMKDPKDTSKNGYSTAASYLTTGEINQQKFLEELRFCKTMREILFEMKISEQIDDFDDILLEISQDARRNAISEKSFKSFSSYAVVLPDSINKTLDKADISISSREFGTFNYENAIEKYTDLFFQRSLRVAALESQINILDKQIGALEKFEKKDLPGKKKMFDDLYDKKNETGRDGKWIFTELRSLEAYLDTIKKEMNDDAAFDAEYKTKSDEIAGLITNAKAAHKEDGKNLTGLEDIKASFDKYKGYVKLDDKEENEYNQIDDAIKNPNKYQDDKPITSDLDPTKLTTEIKKIFIDTYAPNKSGHNGLLSHLNERGD
ncbi:31215_t:CDS:2, partial [Racocetra persica]